MIREIEVATLASLPDRRVEFPFSTELPRELVLCWATGCILYNTGNTCLLLSPLGLKAHYHLSGAISRRVLKDSLGHAFKEMGKTETIPICQKKLRPTVTRF